MPRSGRDARRSVLAAVLGLVVAAAGSPPAAPLGEPVVYKQVDGRQLHLYVSKPPAWRPDDSRPALVMFHGGGWVGGSPRVFNRQAAYFASRGLVCVLAEYRLLDRAVIEPPLVCIRDARSAVRWVRAHAGELGVDPARIASWGASAGGHLAAVTGMMDGLDDPADDPRVSARTQAMILLNPVIHNGPGESGYGYKRTGGEYLRYSPFHNVSPAAAPALIGIGTEDKLVPLGMILEFQSAMRRAQVRCDVDIHEGQGHSFFNPANAGGRYHHLTTVAADRFLRSLGWLEGEPTLDPPEIPAGRAEDASMDRPAGPGGTTH